MPSTAAVFNDPKSGGRAVLDTADGFEATSLDGSTWAPTFPGPSLIFDWEPTIYKNLASSWLQEARAFASSNPSLFNARPKASE